MSDLSAVVFPSPAAVLASGAERQLLEAVQRRAKHPAGWQIMALLLSRMTPPSPRPHHRRIARAMMQDTALRHDGQVFALRNGDLVLLCRAAEPEGSGGAAAETSRVQAVPDPSALPSTLARLLRADCADSAGLVVLWPVDPIDRRFADYIAARTAEAGACAPADDERSGQTSALEAIGALIETARITDLMQRQTAVLLPAARERQEVAMALPAASGELARPLRPLYREVTFSIAALESRIADGGQASHDPFLFRHLAARLDQRMLEVLAAERGSGRPLDVAPSPGADALERPPLHLNLTLSGIMSEAFGRFAAACRAGGSAVGIEVAFMEACADPAAYGRAASRVAEAGMRLVLDGVSHLSLLLTRPGALRHDLMKLEWSPRILDLPEPERASLTASLLQIGLSRIVLHRAETEAAVRWGLSLGIRRFQGRHIDAMLGASRILACPAAAHCTLRQCIERASASGTVGRTGCVNASLLDAGAPAEGAPALAAVPGRVAGAVRLAEMLS